MLRSALLLGCACAALSYPVSALAQDSAAVAPVGEEDITRADDIVVLAGIGYRNRSDESAEPVLEYDTDYFQRFEPLTAVTHSSVCRR